MRLFGSLAVVALATFLSTAAQAATFCVPSSLGYSWVRLGQCGARGGNCTTLPRMSLTTRGQWSCGSSGAGTNHRYSFPAGGVRYYGRLSGDTFYFSRR